MDGWMDREVEGKGKGREETKDRQEYMSERENVGEECGKGEEKGVRERKRGRGVGDREWKVKMGYKEKGVGSEEESQGEGKYGIRGGDWERSS